MSLSRGELWCRKFVRCEIGGEPLGSRVLLVGTLAASDQTQWPDGRFRLGADRLARLADTTPENVREIVDAICALGFAMPIPPDPADKMGRPCYKLIIPEPTRDRDHDRRRR